MKVQLKHLGYQRIKDDEYAHVYSAFAESGWAGRFVDEDFVPDGTYDLPDDVFSADSGDVHWQCDNCGLMYTKRSRPGATIECPMCGASALVPCDIVLTEEEDND